MRALWPSAFVLAPLASAALLGLRHALGQELPRVQGELELPGLDGQVEVHRDRWGVPHIYAQSNADLFFAQGFAHAQDRLWQMELHRRLPQGRLAEAFGPEALEVDRFFRRVGLHRVAQAELDLASPNAREALEAYARGVNAWLEWVSSHQGRLPVEFALTRLQPRPWTALDSLCLGRYLAWDLSENWATEVQRSRLIERLGVEEASKLEQGVWSPAGGDLPPETAAALLTAAEGHGGTEPARRQPGAGRSRWRPRWPRSAQSLVSFAAFGSGPGGSNAWVVAGPKSATGKPLLANDPHLAPRLPCIWYEIHLQGGDYHVAGASVAGMPGVVIGHNERIAWGATAALVDVGDLYVERLHPQDRRVYEYEGRWEQGEVVREVIAVRGRAQPAVDEVLITRHGPVLTPSPLIVGEDRALALQSVVLMASPAADALLSLNRAASWEEFRQALANWHAPPLNFIYADVEGNIGYQLASRVPVRAKGKGLVPAPGWNSHYEWTGWVPFDQLPSRLNPETAYLANANNCPVDPDYPHHLSAEWCAPFRYQRITEQLEARRWLSTQDFRDLQMDLFCLPAKEAATYLGALQEPAQGSRANTALEWALAKLRRWDGVLSAESPAATLYELFKHSFFARRYGQALGELLPLLLGRGPHPAVAAATTYAMRLSQLLVALLRDQGANPDVRAQALEALSDAVAMARHRLGTEPARWQWGRLHRLTLRHALSARAPLGFFFNLGPYPMGGDSDTVLQTSSVPPSLEADGWCPSYRLVCDLADWDNSMAVLPGGQSGQRLSPHYSDQVRLWRAGDYHPMPFSGAAVRSHSRAYLRLKARA